MPHPISNSRLARQRQRNALNFGLELSALPHVDLYEILKDKMHQPKKLPVQSVKHFVRTVKDGLRQEAWEQNGDFIQLNPVAGLIVSKGWAGFTFDGEGRANGLSAMSHASTVANRFNAITLDQYYDTRFLIEEYANRVILQTISNIHDVPEEWIDRFANRLKARASYSPRTVLDFASACTAYSKKFFNSLRECGYSDRIMDAEIALTREIWGMDDRYKIIKMPYFDYIEILSRNADAIEVKLSDLDHNLEDAAPHRRTRYVVAKAYLLAVKAGEIEAGSSIVDFANSRDELKNIPDLQEVLAKESSHIFGGAAYKIVMAKGKPPAGRGRGPTKANGREEKPTEPIRLEA